MYLEDQYIVTTLGEHASNLTWRQRITNYDKETGFPSSLFIAGDDRVVGTWILGNSYQVKSNYYGGYPNTYLRRAKALFPDKKRVLHLFSGMVDCFTMPGDTVDMNASLGPDYVDDAQTLLNVPLHNYDLIMADPPYSAEDAEHYGTTLVKRNLVMKALQRTAPGTHICWLDQVWPIHRKAFFKLEAVIGIVRSTNHRTRMVFIFKRTDFMSPTLC